MAGIMGKDAYIKVWRKAEVLEKELDYEKARNKTLIKEVTADCETIKARDAKIEELKLEVEKWKSKLEHTVKMYEEEAYLVDQARKDEAKRFDEAQDYIFELESIKDFFKNESHKSKEENDELLQKNHDITNHILTLKSEVRKLNAACQAKNVKLDKSYRRNVELRRLMTIIEESFHLRVEEFPEFYLIYNSEKPLRIDKTLLMNINMEDNHE